MESPLIEHVVVPAETAKVIAPVPVPPDVKSCSGVPYTAEVDVMVRELCAARLKVKVTPELVAEL